MKAVHRPGAPTTLKRRFVDPSYMRKLFEVYYMNDEPLTDDLQAGDRRPHRSNRRGDYDVVIATDFGHGMLGQSSIDTLPPRRRRSSPSTPRATAPIWATT